MAIDLAGWVGQRLGGFEHAIKGRRHSDILRRQQFLVVVKDEVIREGRQRIHPAIGLRCIFHHARAKIGEVEIRRGNGSIRHQRLDIRIPARLANLTLIHMQAEFRHIEGRPARGIFDNDLLAMLLFRHHFNAAANACQVFEFLVVTLQQQAARRCLQGDFNAFPGEALPIEAALRIGLPHKGWRS